MFSSDPHSHEKDANVASQLIQAHPAEIERNHTTRTVGRHESARVWRHRAVAGVELFRGSFRKHDFSPHYHSAPTIGIVEHGVMRSWCRRAHHVAPAGSIILYNAEEVHAPGPGNSDGWSFRTFHLDNSVLQRASIAALDKSVSFTQPFVQDQELATMLLQLHRMLEQSATSLEVESRLLESLVQLMQRYASAPAAGCADGKEIGRMGKVRDYIHAHYWQDVTLAQLADVAEFSQYHLLRTFRKAVGLTPHAYLIQTRVEAAKKLLRSGVPPATAALSAGFADQSHFNRHFKRMVGATPGQYHPEARSKGPRVSRLL